MNIAMIMAGGVGKRFASAIPKQYQYVTDEKQVIDYVIEAVEMAKKIDHYIVVMDPNNYQYLGRNRKDKLEIVPNGIERHDSFKNGIDYIHEHYSCESLIVLDAVAPMVTPNLIDLYMEKLEQYDAVITAQRITGGLTDINSNSLNRDHYIMTQSPEAFRFELLYSIYSTETECQEVACQLPVSAKRLYYFDFKDNIKITYSYELEYIKFLLNNKKCKLKLETNDILFTEGICSYLLREKPLETTQWLSKVGRNLYELENKWEIKEWIPSQTSRFGLVLLAKSKKYGDVVIKFIPKFIERYQTELQAYHILSSEYMCSILDSDEKYQVFLLKQLTPAKYACFDDNLALTEFFDAVYRNRVLIDNLPKGIILNYMYTELLRKIKEIDTVPFYRDDINCVLKNSVELWKIFFAKSELYFLHHDLHGYNILKDKDGFRAIDPIGVVAPFEFELVRFAMNDVREHKSFGIEARTRLLIDYFSRWQPNKMKLYVAMYIFMSYITWNGTFESNDQKQTEENLEVIRIVEKIIKN